MLNEDCILYPDRHVIMRFAVLNCEQQEKWRSTAKQPRRNVEGEANKFVEMFVDAYGEPEDQWKAFSCYKAEWPSVEEAVQKFDALFITGSVSHVGDASQKWIDQLCQMLQAYVQQDVRIVGICFGAQILAKALGGRVGRNPGGIGFVARAEDLEVLPPFAKLLAKDVTSLSVIESHGDQVLDLPDEAVPLATSKSCVNEIWCLRTVLAIQAHPEFVPTDVIKTILPSLKQRRMLSLAQVIQNEKNLRAAKLTNGIVRDFVKDFTRTPDFFLRVPYQELFPIKMNSKSDAVLIRQIKEMTEKMVDEPFASSPVTRNPEVDEETKQAVKDGIHELTQQFSTLMLKELKRSLVDYSGVQAGNVVAHEHAKQLLQQAFELYQPIKASSIVYQLCQIRGIVFLKDLRAQREKMTEEANQILSNVTEMIESLETSTHLLEKQTRALRQRLVPTNKMVEV